MEPAGDLRPRTDQGGAAGPGADGGGGASPLWLASVAGLLVAVSLGAYGLWSWAAVPAQPAPPARPAPPATAGRPGVNLKVEVVEELDAMKREILEMRLDPHQTRTWFDAARDGQIRMMRFTVLPTTEPARIGEAYRVRTDVGPESERTRTYILGPAPQTFRLPISKQASSFEFAAVSSPGHGRMTGAWTVGRIETPYSLAENDRMNVPIR